MTLDLRDREPPEQDFFDGAADAIETVTDPISGAALALANPVTAAIRALVPLPVSIQTQWALGIHVEWCVPPTVPPIPVPCAALFMGIATPSVVAIAFDLALYAAGRSPVPAAGVFVGYFKALKAGEQIFGVHLPAAPTGLPIVPMGDTEFVCGSDSVDIKSRHALRFLEQGFGCNRIASPPGPNVRLPNTIMSGFIQYTWPVVAGGTSVLDVQAVGDRVLFEMASWIAGRVLRGFTRALRGAPLPRVVADFAANYAEAFGSNVIRDFLADGEVTASSLRNDAVRAIQTAVLKSAGRAIGRASQETTQGALERGIDRWIEQGGGVR